MTQTDLVLVGAILLLVLACATFAARRVARVQREARQREERRAAALLEQARATRGGPRPASPGPAPQASTPVVPVAPFTVGPATSDPLAEVVRELAQSLRAAADRIEQVADEVSRPSHERAAAVVRLVAAVETSEARRRVGAVAR